MCCTTAVTDATLITGSNHAGTDYEDLLLGGDNSDVISGGAGDDFIAGDEGVDFLNGGEGNDEMQGGTNSDQMRGDGGNDVLLGEAGTDLLKGGEGDDEMYGGDADLVCDFVGDLVCATDQAQILNGGAGNDTIFYENDVGGVCEDRRIDPTSTADGGNDTCGDTDDWAANELPLSCENGTGALPVGCQ